MIFKQTFLRASKAIGLFALVRRFSRPGLRILCYHGFSFDDTHRFRPKVFMTPEYFAARLDFLVDKKYRVLSLEEGLRQLEAGKIARDAVVITIDDGWYSVHAFAAPLLEERKLPSTLYLTSYYSRHQSPVFSVTVQYLFWKTRKSVCDLTGLAPALGAEEPVRGERASRALWMVANHGRDNLDERGRNDLLASLAERLDVPYRGVLGERHLGMITVSEAGDLLTSGMDIQLHSHRHVSPTSAEALDYEIGRNRELLAEVTDAPRRHFAYPGGTWHQEQIPLLEALDIHSATTCDPGVNPVGSHPMKLKRFVDGADVSELEFESELCGFNDLLRCGASLVRR